MVKVQIFKSNLPSCSGSAAPILINAQCTKTNKNTTQIFITIIYWFTTIKTQLKWLYKRKKIVLEHFKQFYALTLLSTSRIANDVFESVTYFIYTLVNTVLLPNFVRISKINRCLIAKFLLTYTSLSHHYHSSFREMIISNSINTSHQMTNQEFGRIYVIAAIPSVHVFIDEGSFTKSNNLFL